MDARFRKKYRYSTDNSSGSAKEKLESILERKWYNPAHSRFSEIQVDGTFTFRTRPLLTLFGNFSRPAYLTGKLSQTQKGIEIDICLSPNLILVILLYLLPLVCINIVWGDNSLLGQQNSRAMNLTILLSIEAALFIFIQICLLVLQRQFERKIGRIGFKKTERITESQL